MYFFLTVQILQRHPQHRRGDEERHGRGVPLRLDGQSQQHDDKVSFFFKKTSSFQSGKGQRLEFSDYSEIIFQPKRFMATVMSSTVAVPHITTIPSTLYTAG